MDDSRSADLAKLYGIFTDNKKPKLTRKNARRSFENIRTQIKDRKLTKLRYRLIRAVQTGTAEESGKIERLIDHYSKKQGWNQR